MSNTPSDLKFTNTHEWVRAEGDGVYTIGISDHAQELLGDMVFIDLPDVGDAVSGGDDCAVAESVKAASDIYSPITGEVVAINEELEDSPELVNSDPYSEGWLFQVKTSDSAEYDDLLDANAYDDILAEEDEEED
ncbi:glycine cleavage system protein GcvH [Celerinatantimonas sp. YJH-8]|uniref:glycine cleavage system protein GcvH n=1 Tax=Celerinatantimonas sp. YJH-8 TaxID=3228714 RepID=UPI0038C0677C